MKVNHIMQTQKPKALNGALELAKIIGNKTYLKNMEMIELQVVGNTIRKNIRTQQWEVMRFGLQVWVRR